jgi:hydroxyacylglutathione hydrolase
MTLELVTVPCLKDNYAFLIHNSTTGETAVVDVPEAPPILDVLQARGWALTDILITHHHWDHIDGVDALRAATGAKVWGASADAHRLPALDHSLAEGDRPVICGEEVAVWDVSGHTMGHIAFIFAASGSAFTADSLMAGGCGRLFEGSPDRMWASLAKFRSLPDETLICSGHEYTSSNIAFALTLEPGNEDLISRSRRVAALRNDGTFTVPSTLGEERATNPFLRSDNSVMKAAIGMEDAAGAVVFAHLRGLKDKF